MRILIVVTHYYPYIGGAELLFQKLAEGMAARGHKVRVITLQLPGTKTYEVINDVEIERVDTPFGTNPFLFSLFSGFRVIKQAKINDIVHTASNYAALSAYLGAKVRGKPIVFTCHEVLGEKWHKIEHTMLKSWIYRIIERKVVTLSYDWYVSISRATNNDLLNTGVNPLRTQVIYCGVDEFEVNQTAKSNSKGIRTRLGIGDDVFLYLYFGRAGVTKGVEHLVRAAPMIVQKIPKAKLIMILSDKPQNEYLRIVNLVEELQLRDKIEFLPPIESRNELARNLIEANCIVIPSVTEGFGFTTAEACSLGIPVVASNVGSIPEVISGKHILVESQSPEAIAEGVWRVWKGDMDYCKPKSFRWEQMVDEYETGYQELVQN